MVKKKDTSSIKQSEQFAKDIAILIQFKGISDKKFFNDVKKLKKSQISKGKFIVDYENLFNGNIRPYGKKAFQEYKKGQISKDDYENKAIESFLGSYRRSTNPEIYSKSDFDDTIIFNKSMRERTQIERISRKEIEKFYDKKEYEGMDYESISKLKNVKDLKVVKQNNLFPYQQVNFLINYDLYDKDDNLYVSNDWITFSSKISFEKSLKELYRKVEIVFYQWLDDLEQSEFQVSIRSIETKVYRFADMRI